MSAPRARKFAQYLAFLRIERPGHVLPAGHDAALRKSLESDEDLPVDLYVAMASAIAEAAPDDFALRFGGSRRLADMGVVGHALMSCESLRQAVGIWSSFSGLAGDPLNYRSGLAGGQWFNDIHAATVMPPALLRFFAEEWISSFCNFAEEMTGLPCDGATIEFRHGPTPGVDYARLLPVRPIFASKRNRAALPAAALDLPILSRDDEMYGLLMQHFGRREAGEAHSGVVAQVRQLFFESAGRLPKLGEAAALLGFSARTLNRRLAGEGTTYARVLAEFRSDYATAMVREGTLGTKQIAHAIGYRSHQSLRRAFAGWTGQPIGAWRSAASERRS